MSRKVHVQQDNDTTNRELRTAVIVTFIAGLTLILLSTAVFALASTTRSLSTDAEKLHTADESLRAATTTRAQLALGLHGSRVDSLVGSDSSASVSASVNEAELALGGFEQSIALLQSDEVVEPANTFLAAALESIESIRTPTSESERDLVDEGLNTSYSAVIKTLTEERERLLASVGAADRRMGTLGNLASFVVAFLLPSSAIFIYRQLARRPRRQVELEHELEMRRRAERERSASFRLGLSHFNSQIESGSSEAVLIEAERLSVATALTYGQHSYDVSRVSLAAALAAISDSAGDDLTSDAAADDVSVLVDQDALRLALGTLIDSARNRGAMRIHLTGRDAPAAGKIELLSDAETIAALSIRDAFLESTELTNASTELQRELIFARTLLEGMGARIEYHAAGEYEKFEITVPRAARSATPVVPSTRAVVS